MRAVEEVVEDRADSRSEPPAPRRARADLWALLSYAVLSALVTFQIWRDPNGRVLASNDDDHNVFLFMLAHGERVIFHGDNPFFSDRLNVPDGVNMMANTSVLVLSLPLAPVTHWFGPGFTVALLITLGLAGTATAWYWVLSRHLVRSRLAAWIGGLWCGFAPTMISHANGHVNFVSQWVLPFIVWQALRLREPGRALRGGLILGLLIVLQVFINEESLLFTALALGVFVIAYAVLAPARARGAARHMAAGLGVAATVAVTLLAYPLWYQFFAKGNYHGQPFAPDMYATDLASIVGFARQSLAGNAELTRRMSVSATEDNMFFGPIGFVMIVASVVVLWRSVAARAAAVSALVLLVMSMGPELVVFGSRTGIPLPFGLISHVPIIDLVSVTRFAMVPATIAGVLLALATDRRREFSPRGQRLWQVGLVLALVPLFPKPLPVVPGDPLPPFLTQGTWRQYVSDDRTLVTVPLPEVTTGRTGMRWATLNHLEYRTPRGYFMGPVNPPSDHTGSWNAPRRFTSDLLWRVREYGERPQLTASDKARITEDLIFWRAAVVIMVPGGRNEGPQVDTLTAALGRPQLIGGVQVWDVRSLPVPPSE
ncbi:glycosyl transferase [Paractinoplanes abujensis]|uniref:DUF6311 domain-containing protein n=1 Tax=Paractinoplanes abujensis TaxID=882441 RepID=A0A7W7G2U8_9ACTN|nr:hypothetical protein [Actinoplanes abujensis]MBB4694207.1 hypothetical protein [Actinoplanes abujensis]GID20578.1 glycosyl transferase [Actinoplanes abujensis]